MTRTLDPSRKAAVTAGLAGLALLVAACSGTAASAPTAAPSPTAAVSPSTAPATAEATAAASPSAVASPSAPATSVYDTDLTGACPAKIVIQTNWYPEADHGYTYQLIGPGGTVDAEKITYSGKLKNTGVQLEIRAGGPATSYQAVSSLLYQDDSITLGYVGTDEAIQLSKDNPTVAVFANFDQNPQAVIWGDPSWDFKSVADIGASGATYLAFANSPYLDVWTGKGLLKPEQVDTSWQGGDARFITEQGKITQQAFITNEPYRLQYEQPEWGKPVKVLAVGADFPVYQSAIAIRADKLEANRACLTRLVPILQQATVDYFADPEPVNKLLVDYIGQLKGGVTLSEGLAAYSAKTQIEAGLVSNAGNATLGDQDAARIQSLIDDLAPVFAKTGKPVKTGLKPADIATNEFLDPAIGLP
jgi:hypothetical protein